MTPLKRHLGRRLPAAAVATALFVLGLGAPASAVPPSITSFSPTSGPVGCVVVLTGTDFSNPTVTSVRFGTQSTTDLALVSGTEIWVPVPTGATDGPISVTNSDGTATSSAAFSVTEQDAGGCAPTVTSFMPTCGPVETDVTITGTNLLEDVDPATDTGDGADVRFAPYTTTVTATAANTTVGPTSITVDVPAGAADGPIEVITPVGTVTSSITFDVGTCITDVNPKSAAVGDTVTITGVGFQGTTEVTFTGAGGTRIQAIFEVTSDTESTDTITTTVPIGTIDGPIQVVAPGGTATFDLNHGDPFWRDVTLRLRRHLVARGTLSAAGGFAGCVAGVPVKIQRRASGRWKTVARTTTTDTGAFKERIRDRAGRYRARAPRITLDDGSTCLADVSPVVRHRH